jgi:hypothetical protein
MIYRPTLLCKFSITRIFIETKLNFTNLSFFTYTVKEFSVLETDGTYPRLSHHIPPQRDTPTIRTPLHTNNMNLYHCGVGWSGRVVREAGRVSRMSGWQLQNTEMRYNTAAQPNQSDPRAESRHVLHIHSMTRQNKWNLIHIRAYRAELC